MENIYTRTRLLLGDAALEHLKASSVAIFGVGGVGSYVAEALARCGVGRLTLIDGDVVTPSNLNRQLVATTEVIGLPKADSMQRRIASINSDCKAVALNMYYSAENCTEIDLSAFDYIADCIDTVSSKLILIERAIADGVPIISSMGAGNKLDPTRFETADIYETSVCPLARVMRRELRARNIARLRVVYSKEPPVEAAAEADLPSPSGRRAVGSIAFVPGSAGLIMASEIVKDIISLSQN